MRLTSRQTGVLAWIDRNFALLGMQVLILALAALAFKVFVLGKYVEAFDDNQPSTMVICRGHWNDFANCAPHTLSFRSHGACERAVDPAFFGIKGFAHTASVKGPIVQVNITCVNTADYKALYPEKVTKEIAGRATIMDDEDEPLKAKAGTVTQPVPQADTGPPPSASPGSTWHNPAPAAAPPAGPPAR